MSADAIKINLRKFSLRASGAYRGRGSAEEFVLDLLSCFGWEGIPDGAVASQVLSVVEHGTRSKRKLDLVWAERGVVVEVVKRGAMLDFAWKELLRVCLQLDRPPQFVVLTNMREVQLYDLATGRDQNTPRLTIALNQLAKYSEALPFLRKDWLPGKVPKIINVEKVSKQVADLVAKLYRSLKASSPDRPNAVIRFTLQSIITMFAEDIGLLPQEYFTTLLYEGRRDGDVEARLAAMFKEMSTKDVANRAIPYFNGGLFNDPLTVPLEEAELQALTKAAEANWKHVDPHIFGSVFQGIMDEDERHASGAHYTAREDIMRVVGPTVVEPWLARIHAASTLAELDSLLVGLANYRVLDPACGSGNFLYVAFRELYKLETELLSRMHEEYISVQKQPRSWASVIRTTNFYGIDINPFAVELAKTTLNIAKKIAFEERKDTVSMLYRQIEMETDRSLPLDNLEKNIVLADALFTEWPEVDAIIGNPPFLGGTKIREELGLDYVRRLRSTFPTVHGKADFCVLWFRLAQERLTDGGRAGLVGTQSIRVGKSREAGLDYITDQGGVITNAVSNRVWPGEAVVHVSMVNWVKGELLGPHLLLFGEHAYARDVIPSHLQLHADVRHAGAVSANKRGSIQGVQFGTKAFNVAAAAAREMKQEAEASKFIRALAGATDLLRGKATTNPSYAVDLSLCASLEEAEAAGSAFQYVEEHVLPFVRHKAETATTAHYTKWLETWWRPRTPRLKFFGKLGKLTRLVVCSCHASRPVFVFLSRDFIPTHSLQVFAFEDDYSYGVLQSNLHWSWTKAVGTRIKEDIRYTSEVWYTYPWPQEPSIHAVEQVADAARTLRAVRNTLMAANNWSLRKLHQASEVDGTHPLKDAQADLDHAVAAAYDIPPGQEITDFLLELNLCLVEDEADGQSVQGPGLPAGLDPKDPRWFSTDCIEPPPLE